MSNKMWAIAVTKYRQEIFAASELRKKGFQVYVAKIFRHPADDDYQTRGAMSLRFPGYLFVQFDRETDPWESINSTKGVEQLLPTKDHPLPIRPPGFVADLRQLEDDDFARAIQRWKPEARPDLCLGDKVRITDLNHDASGQEGYLLSNEKGRAKVLIGSMAWPVADIYLKKIDIPKGKKQSERKAA